MVIYGKIAAWPKSDHTVIKRPAFFILNSEADNEMKELGAKIQEKKEAGRTSEAKIRALRAELGRIQVRSEEYCTLNHSRSSSYLSSL
jgi:ribonuclease BN (tRNA processing enzyme)